MTMIQFSRRRMLQLGLFAAASTAISGTGRVGRVRAAGSAEISVLSDGNLVLPLSFNYPYLTPEQRAQYLAVDGAVPESLNPDCNVTLLRNGDRLILFDVGSGSNFMPTAGRLGDSLAEAGINPSDVTDVVFTHAHPDHLWGVIDDFDEPVFANAAYHINRAEWDYWRDPATVDTIGEARQPFAVGAASRLARLAEMINLFEPGAEVVPGVEAVATYGHTPGHTSFMVHARSEPLLVVGDALAHARISFEQPEWPNGSDQDAQVAIATRKTLLERLAADKAAIIGYHLPRPGEGRVERHGSAYRFVAA
jgi:glyoxylase-like metal-dependent hydrolase (beta-lactamase superfamily II)